MSAWPMPRSGLSRILLTRQFGMGWAPRAKVKSSLDFSALLSTMTKLRSTLLIGLLLIVAAGCASDCPAYPASGKVTYKGKPLPGGGSIRLVPLAAEGGREAGGNIATDGTFKLMTC